MIEDSFIYLCERCDILTFHMTCGNCGGECIFPIGDVGVKPDGYIHVMFVHDALRTIERALSNAIANHGRDHLCYSRNFNYVLQYYAGILSGHFEYGNVFRDLYALTDYTFLSDISEDNAIAIVKKYGFTVFSSIANREWELYESAIEACEAVCSPVQEPDNPGPEPEGSCSDAKCPDCGKCLNPTKPNCSKCECPEHLHEECSWCNKCYKNDDDVCKTRSASHTEDCPTCECCPDCMGPCTEPWTGVGHANIINEAFYGFTSAQISYLNAGSKEADKDQSYGGSHMHGMRAPGQSRAEGLMEMRNFFITEVTKFYDTSKSEEERYFALGMAVHMISDCYSPAHSNKTWIRNTINWIKHVRDLRLFSNRSFNEAKQGTVNVVNQIKNQINSENHDAGAIFDQWSTTMPAYNI